MTNERRNRSFLLIALCCITTLSAMEHNNTEPASKLTTVKFFDPDGNEVATWQLTNDQLKRSSLLTQFAKDFQGQNLTVTFSPTIPFKKNDLTDLYALLSEENPKNKAQELLFLHGNSKPQRLANLADFLGMQTALDKLLHAYSAHILNNTEVFLNSTEPEKLACSELNPILTETLHREFREKLSKYTYQQTLRFPNFDSYRPLAFNKKTGLLASGNNTINLWEFDRSGACHHKQAFKTPPGTDIKQFEFDQTTGTLACVATSTILLFKPDTNGIYKEAQTIKIDGHILNTIAFSPTGTLAAGGTQGISFFDRDAITDTYQLVQAIPLGRVKKLAFHSTIDILAVARGKNGIKLLTPVTPGANTYQVEQTIQHDKDTNLAWHPTDLIVAIREDYSSHNLLMKLFAPDRTGSYEPCGSIGTRSEVGHNKGFAFDPATGRVALAYKEFLEVWERDRSTNEYQQVQTIKKDGDMMQVVFSPIGTLILNFHDRVETWANNHDALRDTTLAQALLLIIAQQKKSRGTPLDLTNYPNLAPLMASLQEEPHKSNEKLQNLIKLLIHQGADSQRS